MRLDERIFNIFEFLINNKIVFSGIGQFYIQFCPIFIRNSKAVGASFEENGHLLKNFQKIFLKVVKLTKEKFAHRILQCKITGKM